MRGLTRHDLADLHLPRPEEPAGAGLDDAAAEAVRDRLRRVVGPSVPSQASQAGTGDGQRIPDGCPAPRRGESAGEPPAAAADQAGPVATFDPGPAAAVDLAGDSDDLASTGGGGRRPLPGETAAALAAFDPGRRGVRVLAGVVALVAVAAGLVAWRSRPTVAPVRPVAAVASTGVAGTAPATLTVAVSGRVLRPGLVHLPAGARVADALDAAGGPLPGTDLALLNLARKLVDGELVLVGVTPSVPVDGTQPGAPGAAPAAGGKVNLNTANLTELQTLPGIGPVLAQRILDFRAGHGGFRTTADLRQVDGIGATRFEQLKDRVTV